MLEKGKISSGEFLILVIIFTIGGSILNVPALLVNLAKQDAWISYLITTLVSLCFVFLYNKLASIYPSKTYVELNEKILGKWVGKVSALLFLFYILYLLSALLYEIGSFSTTQILVGTPIEIYYGSFFIDMHNRCTIRIGSHQSNCIDFFSLDCLYAFHVIFPSYP